MSEKLLVSLLLMALATNLIRVLPVTVIRGKIKKRFIRSFLHYVPYVTLAVMTVPAIFEAATSPLAGGIALIAGIVAAWFGMGLFPVALICCVSVFLSALLGL